MAIGPAVPQEDEDELAGPAMPPQEADGEDGDAWDGRGLGEADEQGDPYRLPVTSEVALEGKPRSLTSDMYKRWLGLLPILCSAHV